MVFPQNINNQLLHYRRLQINLLGSTLAYAKTSRAPSFVTTLARAVFSVEKKLQFIPFPLNSVLKAAVHYMGWGNVTQFNKIIK